MRSCSSSFHGRPKGFPSGLGKKRSLLVKKMRWSLLSWSKLGKAGWRGEGELSVREGALGDKRSEEGNCEQLESRAKQPLRGCGGSGKKYSRRIGGVKREGQIGDYKRGMAEGRVWYTILQAKPTRFQLLQRDMISVVCGPTNTYTHHPLKLVFNDIKSQIKDILETNFYSN